MSPATTPPDGAVSHPRDSIASTIPSAAPARFDAHAIHHQAMSRRWDGWNDAHRGVNLNLGDTESALHLFYQHHPELDGKPPREAHRREDAFG